MTNINFIEELILNEISIRLPLIKNISDNNCTLIIKNENINNSNLLIKKIGLNQFTEFAIKDFEKSNIINQLISSNSLFSRVIVPIVDENDFKLLFPNINDLFADESLVIFSTIYSYSNTRDTNKIIIDLNQITTNLINNQFSAPVIESEIFRLSYTNYTNFILEIKPYFFADLSEQEILQIWQSLNEEKGAKIFEFSLAIIHAWKSTELREAVAEKNIFEFKSIPIVVQ